MSTRIAWGVLISTLLLPTIAEAQTADWSGFYVGGRLGATNQPSGGNERIRFDTDLDGNFVDTVRTVAGADAFSPGFCNGGANDRTPNAGCAKDDEGADGSLMLGYDVHYGCWSSASSARSAAARLRTALLPSARPPPSTR